MTPIKYKGDKPIKVHGTETGQLYKFIPNSTTQVHWLDAGHVLTIKGMFLG